MSLNFPDNPIDGQEYTNPNTSVIYTYSAAKDLWTGLMGCSPVDPLTISKPVIDDTTPKVDDVLSATATADGGVSPYTYEYQWKADTVNIAGATQQTYIVTSNEIGSTITVTVTVTDLEGTENSSTSDATAAVINNTAAPVIDSVALTENDSTGARYTSQAFTAAATMTIEGYPAPEFALKGYVEGALFVPTVTDDITATGSSSNQSENWSSNTAVTQNTAYGQPTASATNMFDGDDGTYYGPTASGSTSGQAIVETSFTTPLSGELKLLASVEYQVDANTGVEVTHDGGTQFFNNTTLGITPTTAEVVIGTFTGITKVTLKYQYGNGAGAGLYVRKMWVGDIILLDQNVTDSGILLTFATDTNLTSFTAGVVATQDAPFTPVTSAITDVEYPEWELGEAANTDQSWTSIGGGGGTAVACYSGSPGMFSSDGENWTPSTQNGNYGTNQWTVVGCSGGTYQLAGINGTGGAYSWDGQTFDSSFAPFGLHNAVDWRAMCRGDGGAGIRWCAVGSSNTKRVQTATSNQTWEVGVSAAEDNFWTGVTAGNGKFVAVSQDGNNRVMYSTDSGDTWTSASASSQAAWKAIAFGNNTFVAVADGYVMYSSDGINWTDAVSVPSGSWNSIAFGGRKFMAVANSGDNRIMSSTNGVSWAVETAPVTQSWSGVCFTGTDFVAVSTDGTSRTISRGTDITLELTNDKDLVNFEVGDVVDVVDGAEVTAIDSADPSMTVDGGTWSVGQVVIGPVIDGSGTVVSNNPSDKTMILDGGRFAIGTKVLGTVPTQVSKLYTVMNNLGEITDLSETDPGFVTQLNSTSPWTTTFPALFPSGELPDVALPIGTSFTVDLKATNTQGSSAKTSNVLIPAAANPDNGTSAITAVSEIYDWNQSQTWAENSQIATSVASTYPLSNMWDGNPDTSYRLSATGTDVSTVTTTFSPALSGELKLRLSFYEQNNSSSGVTVTHSGGTTFIDNTTLGYSGTESTKIIGTYTNITQLELKYTHDSGAGSSAGAFAVYLDDEALVNPWNQSQIWSAGLSSPQGLKDGELCFDGDLNDEGGTANAQIDTTPGSLTFTLGSSITVNTSLEFYAYDSAQSQDGYGNLAYAYQKFSVNGGTNQDYQTATGSARYRWVNTNFTGTLTSLNLTSVKNNTNAGSVGFAAIRVDGVLLVDPSVSIGTLIGNTLTTSDSTNYDKFTIGDPVSMVDINGNVASYTPVTSAITNIIVSGNNVLWDTSQQWGGSDETAVFNPANMNAIGDSSMIFTPDDPQTFTIYNHRDGQQGMTAVQDGLSINVVGTKTLSFELQNAYTTDLSVQISVNGSQVISTSMQRSNDNPDPVWVDCQVTDTLITEIKFDVTATSQQDVYRIILYWRSLKMDGLILMNGDLVTKLLTFNTTGNEDLKFFSTGDIIGNDTVNSVLPALNQMTLKGGQIFTVGDVVTGPTKSGTGTFTISDSTAKTITVTPTNNQWISNDNRLGTSFYCNRLVSNLASNRSEDVTAHTALTTSITGYETRKATRRTAYNTAIATLTSNFTSSQMNTLRQFES